MLLKPLPYADGDRLVLIRQSAPLVGRADAGVSIKEFFTYRDQATADFDALVEFHQMNFDLLKRGEPDRVNTGVVSPNFFDVLGIKPILGRSFVPDDDKPGAPAVLVVSYSYWQRKFGGDPEHRRPGVRDERSAAHRRRRAAERAALSAGERRLHADVRVPVPGRGRDAHPPERARVLRS